MERNVIHEQQEQTYTQVEGGKSKRDCQQQYVPREVIEVLEEAIPMPEEVDLVMVATRMGGMNLLIIPVETVTKGATTTAEEGGVVVEMAIHTTTTETLTSPLRLRFSAFGFCVRLISLLKFPITYIKHFLWFGTFGNWSLGN